MKESTSDQMNRYILLRKLISELNQDIKNEDLPFSLSDKLKEDLNNNIDILDLFLIDIISDMIELLEMREDESK